MTTLLFIFQLIISSSTVNRGDLAQGFTEQNGFYQSSSVSPSRATVQMSEALTLDPLEQLRDPLPKSVRGTEVAAYVRCSAPTTGKASKRAEKKHPVCFPVLNAGLTSYCVHSTQTVVNPTITASAE